MRYYKALTISLTSPRDGTTAWEIGKPMPPIDGPRGGPCGRGYHLAKSRDEAINHGSFPIRLFEAVPCGDLLGEDGGKARFVSAKIVREIRVPGWVSRVQRFIDSVRDIEWMSSRGRVSRKWRLHDTRLEAIDGAIATNVPLDGAYVAARKSLFDAAHRVGRGVAIYGARCAAMVAVRRLESPYHGPEIDAALMAQSEALSDIRINRRHVRHIRDRWAVWRAGYGVAADVNGALYCYRRHGQ